MKRVRSWFLTTTKELRVYIKVYIYIGLSLDIRVKAF